MADENVTQQRKRNLRQTIEGMPMFFNSSIAGDLKAIIQFIVSGKEPGNYHLKIDSGKCTFQVGTSTNPTLTIKTPSEVWLQISTKEIAGQDALFQGLYTAEGDTRLLLKFNSLFVVPDNFSVNDTSDPPKQLFEIFRHGQGKVDQAAPAGKCPAGPLSISGMSWMSLFFIPWTLFWVLFDICSINPWISTGIPFGLMSLIILYRIIFNRPAWPEIASWVFFLAALCLAPIAQEPVFLAWGSIIGSLFMAAMWLISLSPLVSLPFCAEYSKWGFIRALWANSMFKEPNMAISLVWGWTFIVSAGFGIAAKMVPAFSILFTVIRYALMIPGFLFTNRYQKGTQERQFADIDRRMTKQGDWAYAGLAVTLIVALAVWFGLKTAG